MNRKQKIIVSVTSIFLVLLLLVGLTYAYFLTQINGNENSKSISVTTANLALVYGDGNGIITTDEPIMPGTTIDSKTFTVKNEGNAETDYVVVIEDVSVTYATTVGENTAGTATTFESNDFVYTLTCESDGEACDSINTETIFPINNGILVGNKIEVGKTHSYTLTVTYKETGVDQSNDMNKTLEAKVNIRDIAEINPYSSNKNTLAYNIINNAILGKTGTTLLASPITKVAEEISTYYTSGKQNELKINVTSLCDNYAAWLVADTEDAAMDNGSEVSSYEEAIGKYVYDQCDGWTRYLESYDAEKMLLTFVGEEAEEQTLSVTQDDLGVSYYYRGAVEDNYVEFNNMCWRIVRIEGDGSIKITLAAQKKCSEITENDTASAFIGTGDYGYTDDYKGDYENSANRTTSMKYKFDVFLNGGSFNMDGGKETKTYTAWSEENKAKLKTASICMGDIHMKYDINGNVTSNLEEYYYDSYIRLSLYLREEGFSLLPKATLLCNAIGGEEVNAKLYPLTVDEVVYAGGTVDWHTNYNFYLRANASFSDWWTLSLAGVVPYREEHREGAFRVSSSGYVDGYSDVNDDGGSLRPSVSLISNTIITGGNGTINDPYIIG